MEGSEITGLRWEYGDSSLSSRGSLCLFIEVLIFLSHFLWVTKQHRLQYDHLHVGMLDFVERERERTPLGGSVVKSVLICQRISVT